MAGNRPFSHALERLKRHGLRPTRQRLALVKLLFDRGDRHLTADQLHAEAIAAGVKVSLATIYNTLNQFTAAGVLREVIVEAGRSYFDTNTSDHHHVLIEPGCELYDIPADHVQLTALPPLPECTTLRRVEVILRVARDTNKSDA
jgi:Fur family iron response transcriptional regulator